METVLPEDFFHGETRTVFGAMCDLAIEGKPISSATVAQQSGISGLSAWMQGALPEEADYWADEIVSLRRRRSLLAAGEEAVRLAILDGEDVDAAFNKVEQLLIVGASGADASVSPMGDQVAPLLARIDRFINDPESVAGVPTSWQALDRYLDGLQAGGVTAVYAPTSQYKSFFVQNIGWRLACNGVPGLWFTTEMPHIQVLERLVQLESGLNLRQLRWERSLGSHLQEINNAAEMVREIPIWICDRSSMDIAFMRAAAARLKRTQDIKYVIVDLADHVYSMRFRENDVKNESFVHQQLKEIAKTNNVHVIATSHIRKPFNAGGKKDMRTYIDLDDMKGSASKSQDADAAISIMVVKDDSTCAALGGYCQCVPKHRFKWIPMEYEERSALEMKFGQIPLMISIMKNRHGPRGSVPFILDLARGGQMQPISQ